MNKNSCYYNHKKVALLAEGVDRNSLLLMPWKLKPVALLAEGVDRNKGSLCTHLLQLASPSSRRAWIEIYSVPAGAATVLVALLAEGVDRNKRSGNNRTLNDIVALLAEGVDRNLPSIGSPPPAGRRPPRGGRG